MSRTRRVGGYMSRERLYRMPKYTGWLGEGIWKPKTRKWWKRVCNKALRRDNNERS